MSPDPGRACAAFWRSVARRLAIPRDGVVDCLPGAGLKRRCGHARFLREGSKQLVDVGCERLILSLQDQVG